MGWGVEVGATMDVGKGSDVGSSLGAEDGIESGGAPAPGESGGAPALGATGAGGGDWTDIREGLWVAAPVALAMLLDFGSGAAVTLVAGQWFGIHELTGMNLGFVMGNLVGVSFVHGMQSAAETLQPVAFGAAKYDEVGDLTVRALVVSAGFVLLCSPLWVFGGDLLLALGQPPEVAHFAGLYLRLSYPAVLGNAIYESMRRFHAAQEIVWPWVGLAATALAAQLLFLVVSLRATDFAFECIPLSTCVFWATAVAAAVWYCGWRAPHHPGTWVGFRWSALEWDKLRAYLALAVPGLVGYSGWWFWEFLSLLVGTMGVNAQAAHIAAYVTIPLYVYTSEGIGVAANVIIGHHLGRGDILRAKALARRYKQIAAACSVMWGLVHYALKPAVLAATVGDVPEARALAEGIWWLTCFFAVVETYQEVETAIVRTIAQQARMSIAMCTFYWVVGAPVIYIFALRLGGGLPTLWVVYPCISLCIILSGQFIQRSVDWTPSDVAAQSHAEDTCDGLSVLVPRDEV